jgi:hypothetical protein
MTVDSTWKHDVGIGDMAVAGAFRYNRLCRLRNWASDCNKVVLLGGVLVVMGSMRKRPSGRELLLNTRLTNADSSSLSNFRLGQNLPKS